MKQLLLGPYYHSQWPHACTIILEPGTCVRDPMVGGALSLSGIGPVVRDEAGKISYPREQRTGGAFVNAGVAYGSEEMTYEAGGWDIR